MTSGPAPTFDRTEAGTEFDLAMARAGVTIPLDRRPALVSGYEDLKRRTALLRQPRKADDEPAATYRVRPRGTA